ncbi:GNAT family N-acetyltransferase [Alkalilimnicola ehrlichii]|uniref:GNAT family N-acetyltransferase n=1 Tax=Alkalilimnicola ehrlichii TaxID=351052 RepID=A0A3E0X352_9GAMM|nr:GNAT family N-acetyltransferase [Alkalilimnicola ehrlichii]RFA30954.1 GNAT family N-acetyltransferase [Alkalilimnicola ehrlichii]RFA38905.1 GNAT family N-acetyltransferase [Alkalilimnicola ehrlichii]
MEIRKADTSDIESIASIYQACFPNESNHKLWVESSFNSYPRGVYYVISLEGQICGYILWSVKNGFRENTIIELEQIGIHPNVAGKGLGRKLIEKTLDKFKEHLNNLGHNIGAIVVTTSEGNFAERLYQSTLGVTRAAVIAGYGSGNEIILYNNRID